MHPYKVRLSRRTLFGAAGLGAGVLILGGCGNTATRLPALLLPPALRKQSLRPGTWAYNGQVPGPEIRVTEGDTLRNTVGNGLPKATSIHGHGLAIPTAMDGVPRIT